MIQKVKDKFWTNEAGNKVPVEYVSASLRLREKYAAKIYNDALNINKKLVEFKQQIAEMCDEIYNKSLAELNTQVDKKGNFTFYNFDRSIKIEVSVHDRIDFDDITITACKSKLDEFLSISLDAKTEFVKDLVSDAFSTTSGKLDAKKVMSLMRYKGKIKDSLFEQAIDLLAQSIRKPDSRRYFRVSVQEEDGGYTPIDLNFSSVK